ncbi:MAG: hypothetical protein BWY52_02901 [Chloroflexi bacterium ADurb.Bin325]|nr:MAG: hypothetical protein BWY52_02901 [Chloroflexi bacterium ADurb.Bin325]
MSCVTESSGAVNGRPKSSRTALLTHTRYCCQSGLSMPYLALNAWTCSGGSGMSAFCIHGPPGTARESAKVNMESSSSMTMMPNKRRRI